MCEMNEIEIIIIDSGVKCNHSSFQDVPIRGFQIYDSNVIEDFEDTYGHGTAIYGIIKKVLIAVSGENNNNANIRFCLTDPPEKLFSVRTQKQCVCYNKYIHVSIKRVESVEKIICVFKVFVHNSDIVSCKDSLKCFIQFFKIRSRLMTLKRLISMPDNSMFDEIRSIPSS